VLSLFEYLCHPENSLRAGESCEKADNSALSRDALGRAVDAAVEEVEDDSLSEPPLADL
jgi:hypothetical protein